MRLKPQKRLLELDNLSCPSNKSSYYITHKLVKFRRPVFRTFTRVIFLPENKQNWEGGCEGEKNHKERNDKQG